MAQEKTLHHLASARLRQLPARKRLAMLVLVLLVGCGMLAGQV